MGYTSGHQVPDQALRGVPHDDDGVHVPLPDRSAGAPLPVVPRGGGARRVWQRVRSRPQADAAGRVSAARRCRDRPPRHTQVAANRHLLYAHPPIIHARHLPDGRGICCSHRREIAAVFKVPDVFRGSDDVAGDGYHKFLAQSERRRWYGGGGAAEVDGAPHQDGAHRWMLVRLSGAACLPPASADNLSARRVDRRAASCRDGVHRVHSRRRVSR
mmetsp:Transcript_16147/g.43910  ORF Transcript_16147/g.43910 Transcript_16147/m.43910 type:complete len:215 (+) Transcript_16147:513-1157(+)